LFVVVDEKNVSFVLPPPPTERPLHYSSEFRKKKNPNISQISTPQSKPFDGLVLLLSGYSSVLLHVVITTRESLINKWPKLKEYSIEKINGPSQQMFV
jgi:hypothetical protein